MKNAGIDYGLGKTNIDLETGIRYGIISVNSLDIEFYEDFEYNYGEACCPKCDNRLISTLADKDWICESCADIDEDTTEEELDNRGDLDRFTHWDDECYPEEPVSITFDKEGYKLELTDRGNIFVFESPYYTFTNFCSPCVPGAGNLDDINDKGVKTYCLGFDWFASKKVSYPVYSVETGELI